MSIKIDKFVVGTVQSGHCLLLLQVQRIISESVRQLVRASSNIADNVTFKTPHQDQGRETTGKIKHCMLSNPVINHVLTVS